MNHDEFRARFEKNVAYLERNIPPDDIYIFTEQTFMAAMFFLLKWREWVDIDDEMAKDPVVKKWVNNILCLETCKDNGIDLTLDLDLESLDDETGD